MQILDIRQPGGGALFTLCAGAVLWVAVSGMLAIHFELPRVLLLAILFLVIRLLFMRELPSPTASGAIVMGIGIFINGAFNHLGFSGAETARSLAVVLFVLLLFIAFAYLRDVVRGEAFQRHFANPVAAFAVGTWIAGTSVCAITLSQRLPEWQPLIQTMVVANIGLWLYFAFRSVKNFVCLFAREYNQKVHGVLLLSTVSTQSLVIAWKAAFGSSEAYRLAAPWLIGLGILFYGVSFFLIVRRYVAGGTDFDLDRDWFNTNCILHGAMSITGLASIVCGVIPQGLILLIWLWVIAWFILVEAVENIRAVRRVQHHGFAKGLLAYDPTQWSRNFTFGMLYAFTMNFDLGASVAPTSMLLPLQAAILSFGAWVVLCLLLIEIFVFLRDRLLVEMSTPEASQSVSGRK